MEQEFTRAQGVILQKQEITDAGPGTILPDFEALIDFVGVGGIESGGKHKSTPTPGRVVEMSAMSTLARILGECGYAA